MPAGAGLGRRSEGDWTGIGPVQSRFGAGDKIVPREPGEDRPDNFGFCLGQGQGRNDDDAADKAAEREIGIAIEVQELDRIFRLTCASLRWVGIEDKAYVRMHDQGYESAQAEAHRGIAQIEIGQLIVDVAIEDYDVGAGATGAGGDAAQGEGVEEVHAEAQQSHQRRADILVAAVDGRLGGSDAFIAAENPVASILAKALESGDIVPKDDGADEQAGIAEGCAKMVNLCAFAGAIDPRKADEDGRPGP